MTTNESPWPTARVADLLREGSTNGISVRGSDDPPGVPSLKLDALTDHGIDATRVRYIDIPKGRQEALRLRAGDFLVSRGNGSLHLLARCCIVSQDMGNTVFPDTMIRLRFSPSMVDLHFLRWFWRTAALRAQVATRAKTTAGIWKVSQRDLASLEVPLPPLPEQRRIVARIEVLFARTRRARADLERVAPLSTRYAEQSRRRAFDEDATWPMALPDRRLPDYTPPVRFDEVRNLPAGWRWAEMSTVGSVAGGITKNQRRSGQPLEMPYLRVANVYADQLRVDDVTTIRVTHAELERVRLQLGDLLIVEGNGSVEQIGRVAVWDGSIVPCGHQNHLIRVRPAPGVPPRFLLHWLMSPYGRSILETVASSSSGLHTLSLSKIAAVPTPVAPTLVADIVSNTLDKRLQSVRAVQSDAARALALLDRLEQSILTRAFRGELVSQDPADEPARLSPTPIASHPCHRRAAPSGAAL